MSNRTCLECHRSKPLGDYWNCRSCTGGKDYKCSECRVRAKRERAATPAGIYELQARLITQVVRHTHYSETPAGMVLDHRYSIRQAFLDGIPLEMVCNPRNLEWLGEVENRIKATTCSITKDELEESADISPALRKLCESITLIRCPVRLADYSKQLYHRYKEARGEDHR